MKRNICVVTGSRSEYGLLKPVIEAIEADRRLRLQLVATGMHLSPKHGYSIDLIRRDGYRIAAVVDSFRAADSGAAMAETVSLGISGLAAAFLRLKPDLLLILGDRTEALAAAVAATYMNVPIAHIHGGDVGAGCVDNSVRDAITKLAQLHFAASRRSQRRIIRLGEEKWRVFNTGSPGIDYIMKTELVPKPALFGKYRLRTDHPLALVVQHPVTTEVGAAGGQMRATMAAVKRLGWQTTVIYPNTDAGNAAIIREINRHRRDEMIRIIPNLPHLDYLSFLKYAAIMIGNSSSGIIEAPSFKLPVVNVGVRQQGRERANNVIDVPHDAASIVAAVGKITGSGGFRSRLKRCRSPYGDGRASERIVKIIAGIRLGNELLQKRID